MSRLLSFAVAFMLLSITATAHELTPTYPDFKASYLEGIKVTTMQLWNRRTDVEYYEISVYDSNWKEIPFATSSKILKLQYLDKKKFEIYLRSIDINNVEFICTTSKSMRDDVISTGVTSRICSRIK